MKTCWMKPCVWEQGLCAPSLRANTLPVLSAVSSHSSMHQAACQYFQSSSGQPEGSGFDAAGADHETVIGAAKPGLLELCAGRPSCCQVVCKITWLKRCAPCKHAPASPAPLTLTLPHVPSSKSLLHPWRPVVQRLQYSTVQYSTTLYRGRGNSKLKPPVAWHPPPREPDMAHHDACQLRRRQNKMCVAVACEQPLML